MILSDHSIRRHCLAESLAAYRAFEPIESVAGTDEAWARIHLNQPLILLINWTDEPIAVCRLIQRVVEELSAIHVVVVGLAGMDQELEPFLCAGRLSFVLESESVELLHKHLKQVLEGQAAPAHCFPNVPHAVVGPLAARLTAREQEILDLIAKGFRNGEIASQLRVSPHTIKNHIHNMLEKLDAPDRHSAARRVYGEGWYQRARG